MTGTVELPQRLAAILAADAVGFSSLMANDERATLAALEDARAVFRAQVAQQGGRVVDTAGDSVLAVSDSASAAVGAAMAVQEVLEGRTTQAPGTARLRYRIGIHLGEVLTQPDGSVYGDGVNAAARLQAVAEPGRIVVSAAVRGAIGTRLGVGFDDLGERAFKNIAAPLRAFRVQAGAASAQDGAAAARRWPRSSRVGIVGQLAAVLADAAVGLWARTMRPGAADLASSASARTITVAVLPFTATGAGPAALAWAEAMAGTLTNALSRWSEASVAAPGQVRKLQGQGLDPDAIGRALPVRYLVEGEIAPRGGKLVVAPRVIDAASAATWPRRWSHATRCSSSSPARRWPTTCTSTCRSSRNSAAKSRST